MTSRPAARRVPSRLAKAVRNPRKAARVLLGTEPPQPQPKAEAKTKRRRGHYIAKPGPKLPTPEPVDDMDDWVEPTVSDGRHGLGTVLYDTGAKPVRFDVELLEQLNQEYASKPIVPQPPSYQSVDKIAVAKKRIAWVQQRIDLREKTTLEIGCGHGYEAWLLAHNLGGEAYAVDINEHSVWKELEGDRVHYECGDLTVKNPFPDNTFDAIYSFVVWEHVTHPRSLLQETYNVLKPGGLAWIRANLFCGPQASHRYREINFPWPHLLFSEDVIRDWDEQKGHTQRGPAWVNRLTWDNYERYISEIGFNLRHVSFTEAKWDEEFYQRFEDMLGRYARRDLKRDYFLAVLEKPA